MFFVDRPVHADSGLQLVQLPVAADPIGDGGQGGGAETSGAGGDGVAAHSHHAGVDLVPLQTQLGQDVFHVFQAVFLPERNDWTGGSNSRRCPQTADMTLDSHSSISEMNLVSKEPGSSSASEACPLNRKLSSVSFTRSSRTISPKYMPLIIFSKLQEAAAKEQGDISG